jgi:hypothetical protein
MASPITICVGTRSTPRACCFRSRRDVEGNRLEATVSRRSSAAGLPSHWRWRFRRERPWYIPRQGRNRHLDTVRSDEACNARGVRPRSSGSLCVFTMPVAESVRNCAASHQAFIHKWRTPVALWLAISRLSPGATPAPPALAACLAQGCPPKVRRFFSKAPRKTPGELGPRRLLSPVLTRQRNDPFVASGSQDQGNCRSVGNDP